MTSARSSLTVGAQGVPPNADICYEIELISWFKVEDLSKCKDGSVLLKFYEESGGYTPKPKDLDVVIMKNRCANKSLYVHLKLFPKKRQFCTDSSISHPHYQSQSSFECKILVRAVQGGFRLFAS
jgi:hypothetical protein